MASRIGKKIGIILGIVAFVVVAAILANIYFGQIAERNELDDRLLVAGQRLDEAIDEKQELEGDLERAEAALARSAARYPERVESIEYGEDLFRIAFGYDICTFLGGLGLRLTGVTASEPTDREVGPLVYSVSPFTVRIEGDTDSLLKFVDAVGIQVDHKLTWDFQEPWSVGVTSVTMTPSTATIGLEIYGYSR